MKLLIILLLGSGPLIAQAGQTRSNDLYPTFPPETPPGVVDVQETLKVHAQIPIAIEVSGDEDAKLLNTYIKQALVKIKDVHVTDENEPGCVLLHVVIARIPNEHGQGPGFAISYVITSDAMRESIFVRMTKLHVPFRTIARSGLIYRSPGEYVATIVSVCSSEAELAQTVENDIAAINSDYLDIARKVFIKPLKD